MYRINEKVIKAGRSFYGICIAALGIQQLFYAEFRPVLLPHWPSWIPGLAVWVYLASAALIGSGVAIILEKKARTVALVLGGMLLVLLGLCHVPYQIIANPYIHHLGTWSDQFKVLALSEGGFVVAGSFPDEKAKTGSRFSLIRLLETFIPVGGVFFSITMITFGICHFLYVENVSTLVPAWIPGHVFWTYFAAVALIGSGTAIILRIKINLVGILLGTMIFLWFVFLHIPRAIADPFGLKGNEVTSVFEALGFSGIAFVIAYQVRLRERSE